VQEGASCKQRQKDVKAEEKWKGGIARQPLNVSRLTYFRGKVNSLNSAEGL